jgi:hypothetical protein
MVLCGTKQLLKLGELCGASVNLLCQLPMEDLDAMVSITFDEDLANPSTIGGRFQVQEFEEENKVVGFFIFYFFLDFNF